jgi:hypothetical protein
MQSKYTKNISYHKNPRTFTKYGENQLCNPNNENRYFSGLPEYTTIINHLDKTTDLLQYSYPGY